VLLAAAFASGCVSYKPVPLTNGTFPRGSVLVGDDVRVAMRDGELQRFRVAGVENGVLTTSDGQTINPTDVTVLERKTTDKKATIITLSIIGGVILTTLVADELDDCEDDPYCDYY
jgi:hypothetical protein